MLKKLYLFCALLLVTCCTSEPVPRTSYLFLIMSNHGEIKKAPDGSYKLILDHSAIEQMIAFSDRPHPVVRHINAEQFKTLWREGSNSFAKDPPNATVIINNHLQTVVLINIKIDGTKTIFTVRSDGHQNLVELKGGTQLFVDTSLIGGTTTCSNCFPHLGVLPKQKE